MEITFERLDKNFHFKATNELGISTETDGSPDIGGGNKAMRPMHLMLVGLGSCSGIDIIHLLRKMRQEVEDVKIKVTAEREQGKTPSLFTKIHVHYDLYGPVEEKKAEKALSMSLEKYCSVAKLLEKTATISGSFTVHS